MLVRLCDKRATRVSKTPFVTLLLNRHARTRPGLFVYTMISSGSRNIQDDRSHTRTHWKLVRDSIKRILRCPLSMDTMRDPVIDPTSGNSCERRVIERWLQEKPCSPFTRTALTIGELVPNRTLRDLIRYLSKPAVLGRILQNSVDEEKKETEPARSHDEKITINTENISHTGEEKKTSDNALFSSPSFSMTTIAPRVSGAENGIDEKRADYCVASEFFAFDGSVHSPHMDSTIADCYRIIEKVCSRAYTSGVKHPKVSLFDIVRNISHILGRDSAAFGACLYVNHNLKARTLLPVSVSSASSTTPDGWCDDFSHSRFHAIVYFPALAISVSMPKSMVRRSCELNSMMYDNSTAFDISYLLLQTESKSQTNNSLNEPNDVCNHDRMQVRGARVLISNIHPVNIYISNPAGTVSPPAVVSAANDPGGVVTLHQILRNCEYYSKIS